MANKKITKSVTLEQFDHQTGEKTTSEVSNTFNVPAEPPYVKMYLEDIQKFYDLPESGSSIIYELLRKLDYDNLIVLNSTVKKIMCTQLGIKIGSLDNYLLKLTKAGLFKRIGTGTYVPNPHIFGRGKWQDIYKLREAWITIKYTTKGKMVKTSLGEGQEEEWEEVKK
jgi:hypothetical protein